MEPVTPLMSYEQFFGLNDAPFSIAPNPKYLFESASHAAALQQLAYAIERREPLIVMTGEIGTGKTLLCRTLIQRRDRRTFVSVINNPLLEWDDLLRQMLQDFGVLSTDRTTAPATSRHDLVHALEDFLFSLIGLGGHAIVLIDEAQHVQPAVLEQIRLLSNIDTPGGTMLEMILIGQLDLDALLARADLRQFQQRVSRRIRLAPLGQDELQPYIDHRLAVGRAAGSGLPGAGELAGALGEWEGTGAGVTFNPDAVRAIWRWSGGLPRVVNLLCDRALEAACPKRIRTIDAELVDTAAMTLGLSAEPAPPEATPPQPAPHALPPVLPLASPSALAPVDIHVMPTAVGVEPALDIVPLALAPAPKKGKAPLIAALAVAVAAAAWFAVRAPARGVGGSSVTPAGGPAPSAAPAVVPQTSAPSPERATVAAPVNPPPAATAVEKRSAPSVDARDAIGPSFEIIVASFRTEARAASVAAQVGDAGLTVKRRTIGGWQQVIAGPFPSREEADAAHQRLERAGLPGTQVVLAPR